MSLRRWLRVALLAALVVACGSPPASPGDQPVPVGPLQEGVVTRIVDGDTIWVRLEGGDVRVRYIGIDAPEMGDAVPDPWAQEATDANRRLVDGRRVLVETDVSETDRFGRLLRYVWLPVEGADGADAWLLVNLELVRLGLAHARSYPPDVRHQHWLRAAESEARDAGTGLWSDAAP